MDLANMRGFGVTHVMADCAKWRRLSFVSRGKALGAYVFVLPGGFVISDDRERIDMEFVHRALTGAYWAAKRPRELTVRAFRHSLCLGVYAPDGTQAGFGRVVTDYALRAHLADFYVDPSKRGLGLGKAMVETVLTHPELATVAAWTLTTSDAQALYFSYGFRASPSNPNWMTLTRNV
jgi:GNAT superfamily N-acetyltransferase